MTTKNDDGLRARMATLLKTPVPVLRKRLAATGQDPAGLSKDALVKALANAGAPTKPGVAAPPTKEHAPTKQRRPRAAQPKHDPRLPAVGGRITRLFKGREYVLEVLERGFRVGSAEYASPTAAALALSGYSAVSGPAWWGYAKPRATNDQAPTTALKSTPAAPAKKRAGRPITKRRGG